MAKVCTKKGPPYRTLPPCLSSKLSELPLDLFPPPSRRRRRPPRTTRDTPAAARSARAARGRSGPGGRDGAGFRRPPAAAHGVFQEGVDGIQRAAGAVAGEQRFSPAVSMTIPSGCRPSRFRSGATPRATRPGPTSSSGRLAFGRWSGRGIAPRHLLQERRQLLGGVFLAAVASGSTTIE